MSGQDYHTMSDSEKKKEDWMNSKWRPMMGWSYMLTCICDFVLFPILWTMVQTILKQPVTQWQPITLQGAGLYHIAMGAVLGIAAFGRTQEKLNDKAGATSGGLSLPTGMPAAPSPAPATPVPSFGAPASTGFSAPKPTPSFSAPASTPSFGAPSTPMMSSTGKPMPIQPDQPEL